jgi:sortase A
MTTPSSDHRTVDELSLEELESALTQRRRIEHARQLAEDRQERRFRHAGLESDTTVAEREPINKRRRPRDLALLLVEIGAVAALDAVIIGSLGNLDALNREVLEVRALAVPTENSLPEELPASPFPPANNVQELPGSSFAPEPAPPELGLRLRSVAAILVPTTGPRAPTRIVIPAIKVDWPVVEGDGWEELKQGIGHRPCTANPGERGNMVLSGHNDVYGEPFRDLEIIQVGKEVLVYSGANAFRYIIKAKRVVLPTDLSPLNPSRTTIVTLITCTPYQVDTMRLIVIGELVP